MHANSGASLACSQAVGALVQTAIDYPPMQAPASFNLEAIKAQVDEVIKGRAGQ
jgi:arylsulfatase